MITKVTQVLGVKALQFYRNELDKIIDLKRQALKKEGMTEKQIETEIAPLWQEFKDAVSAKTEIEQMDVFADSQEYSNKLSFTNLESLSFMELERNHPEHLKHIALSSPTKYKQLYKNQYGIEISDKEMVEVHLAYGGDGNITKPTQHVSPIAKQGVLIQVDDNELMSKLAKSDLGTFRLKLNTAYPGISESAIQEFIDAYKNM